MNQQKALKATAELTIFLMQLQGEEGPETNLLQLDTCSKFRQIQLHSVQKIKRLIGGHIQQKCQWKGDKVHTRGENAPASEKRIKLKVLHETSKFSVQIWCRIHTHLHLRRMCNIEKNILRQSRQSGQPMHTSSYRGLKGSQDCNVRESSSSSRKRFFVEIWLFLTILSLFYKYLQVVSSIVPIDIQNG